MAHLHEPTGDDDRQTPQTEREQWAIGQLSQRSRRAESVAPTVSLAVGRYLMSTVRTVEIGYDAVVVHRIE